jgi:hypothetical protein
VENAGQLFKFQGLLDRLSVRPTYLVTYPFARNRRAVRILKSILQNGNCEIGAHLHPWCNPPFLEDLDLRNTFPCNLTTALQLEKLKELGGAVEESFGVTPKSYRAGRFGFNGSTLPALERLGYLVDSSVCPLMRWAPEGVNFISAEPNPYFPDYKDVTRPGRSSILEVPLSIGFVHPFGHKIGAFVASIINGGPLLLKAVRKLPIFNMVWLRPAIHSLVEMIALSEVLIKRSVSCLNLMLHSSELLPGGSPYNKTQNDVDAFLDKIERYILWTKNVYEIRAKTLTEFRNAFCSP